MVIRVYSEIWVWHWKLFQLDIPSSASDAPHTHTHTQGMTSHTNWNLCHLHWHWPEASNQPEIKIFLTDICLHIRKCEPVSKWFIWHVNVTNNKYTFSKSHGPIAKTINVLCIAILLKGMGFLTIHHGLVCMSISEHMTGGDPEPPRLRLPTMLRIWGCCKQAMCIAFAPLRKQTPNGQDLTSFLSCPPKLWISQRGDAEWMVPAGHMEGSWCRACSSPTCYICSQKSFLPPSALFFFFNFLFY